jgi:hypothetical protein
MDNGAVKRTTYWYKLGFSLLGGALATITPSLGLTRNYKSSSLSPMLSPLPQRIKEKVDTA